MIGYYVTLFSFLVLGMTCCGDPTSPSSPSNQGLEGGPCNPDSTCTGNLVCVEGSTCRRPSDGGDNQTTETQSDTDTDEQGGTHENEWTKDEAIVTSSTILCEHLVACFGDDFIQFNDCLEQQISSADNDDCLTFDADKVQPCITCLEERIACPEIRGMTLMGYPLSTYCPICDEICD